MDIASLKTLNAERRARRAAILLTDLGDGSSRIVHEHDEVAGELGEAVARGFRTGNSGAARGLLRFHFASNSDLDYSKDCSEAG